MTIPEMLRESVRRHGAANAFGVPDVGAYRFVTYDEAWTQVRALGRGLAALGLKRGDRIAILSENRLEWALCDLAAQCLGLVTVPIYPTLPGIQVAHLVRDSAARVLFASDAKQAAKVAAFGSAPSLEHVVRFDIGGENSAMGLEEVLRRGREAAIDDRELDARAAALSEDDPATLIYTSGTTGEPKGAILSHRALLHTGAAALEFVHVGPGDVFLSFLPLCHVIERVGGHYLPLMCGATIVYSQGVFALASEFARVEPTVFLCVPRVYEAMQEKLQEHIAMLPARRRKLVNRACETGRQWSAARRTGRPGALLSLRQALADRFVLRRIRERMLGRRIRFLVSGGAPLNPQTIEMLEVLGVPVLEGYGLTEFPVISLNRPGRTVVGSVGEPLPGIDVRFADDGEILARGPSRMDGYFGKPNDTAQAIDAEGWFHTGDIGEPVTDRIFRITDRKKDIIVLSNGKNVAPQAIEKKLKESPYIAEAVLLGDRRSTVSAILVPAFDLLKAWAREHGRLAPGESELHGLLTSPEVRALFREEIDRLSSSLADFERVKRFVLAPQPFTVEGGELTPTLKVRRRVVLEKYAALVEQLTGQN